jgi:hypothetical protein
MTSFITKFQTFEENKIFTFGIAYILALKLPVKLNTSEHSTLLEQSSKKGFQALVLFAN